MGKIQWKKGIALLLAMTVMCMSCILNVNASSKIRSKSVAVNVSKVTMGVGDIVTLDAIMTPTNSTDKLTWSSSKRGVATVNKYGVVTAVREGTSTITVKTSSKKSAKCVITVKKVLTEKEISDLISQNCLSEESIKKMISENTISESQVIGLIKQNSLTENDVKTLIKQNSLTEDDVKTLIKQNSLTEDDVKRIVTENSGSVSNGKDDWEDGTELTCLEQSLPRSFTNTYIIDKKNNIKKEYTTIIEKISVKKYHCTDEWDGCPQKYKYVVEIEGILPERSDTTLVHSAEIKVTFENDGERDGRRYSFLSENEFFNGEKNEYSMQCSENNGKFILTVEQYGIYEDYDEFDIGYFEFSTYEVEGEEYE